MRPRFTSTQPSAHRAAGFTLVEILIVVFLLAILAAMVLPQFTSATEQTRENTLHTSLWRVRQQIQLYRHHHDGQYPSIDNFDAQLTQATNADGQTAAPDTPGYSFGPYLDRIPINPYTNGKTVGDGEVATSDWYYNENTGEFLANHTEAARDL